MLSLTAWFDAVLKCVADAGKGLALSDWSQLGSTVSPLPGGSSCCSSSLHVSWSTEYLLGGEWCQPPSAMAETRIAACWCSSVFPGHELWQCDRSAADTAVELDGRWGVYVNIRIFSALLKFMFLQTSHCWLGTCWCFLLVVCSPFYFSFTSLQVVSINRTLVERGFAQWLDY